MSAEMSVPRVGIHRLIDAGRRSQKYEDQPCVCTGKTWNRKNSLVARSCEKTPAAIWTIDFVQGIIWFGDNPCRKNTENHGICDRKKLAKNTKNNKVYAQPIQEIQRKPTFFDRSHKPNETKSRPPRRNLCSGFKFIYDKGFGRWGHGKFCVRKNNHNNDLLCPTSNRLYSTSFVKTNAARELPASGTAVLTVFWKNCPKQIK